MNKNETKKTLLDVGMNLVLERGYNHTGLTELLEAADVPKGSFYYYFSSKEDFGLHLIEQFGQDNQARLHQFLDDENFDPLTRLRNYFQFNIDYLEGLKCRQGCLMGNLGQELADQNENFRVRVQQVMEAWAEALADCIRQAQAAEQISDRIDAQQLGQFCLNNWEGAILQMKISKNKTPLQLFMQSTFEVVLKG